MGPEFTDRVIRPAVDFVQQNWRAFIEEVGAQGRDGGGRAANVEPEGREVGAIVGEFTGALSSPLGAWELCPEEDTNSRQPQCPILVPHLPPAEFLGWHFPAYKSLENKRLCGQICVENIECHTCPF